MAERGTEDNPLQQRSAFESKEAYARHAAEVFRQLEDEPDPGVVDVEANELLLLVIAHPELNLVERLREVASISHITMIHLRRLGQPHRSPETVAHAELVHGAYEQVYAHAIVELAKIGDVGSGAA
jgi:hypothetical protein